MKIFPSDSKTGRISLTFTVPNSFRYICYFFAKVEIGAFKLDFKVIFPYSMYSKIKNVKIQIFSAVT